MKQRLIVLILLFPFISCTLKKPAPPPPSFPSYTDAELLSAVQNLNLDIQDTPRGHIVTLPGVFFGFNNANLTPEAQEKVNALAEILKYAQIAQRKVVIQGHTDSIGPGEYNLKLSQERAKAVEQALLAAQVQQDRLHVEGFGEARPIAFNANPDGSDNPEGRAQNRRVEVIIQK